MIKEQGFKKAGIGLLVYIALIVSVAYLPFRLGYGIIGGFGHEPEIAQIILGSILCWIVGIFILAVSACVVAGTISLVKFAIKEIGSGKHSKTFRGLENMGEKAFGLTDSVKKKLKPKEAEKPKKELLVLE